MVACVLLSIGCDGDRNSYLSALRKTIRSSDRIVVTEHSHQTDLYDLERGKSLVPREIVYRTVDLTSAQRLSLGERVETLDPRPQQLFLACANAPHHSIYFYQGGRQVSVMDVCFECARIEWTGSREVPPDELLGRLGAFFRTVGLEPERDWKALAMRNGR